MTTRILRALLTIGAALATLLTLVGCSAGEPVAAPPAQPDADTTFLQMMIPHHQQAVAMADLAPARAASPGVKDLAVRIRGAQGPEIEEMNRLLAARGAAPTGTGGTGMGAMGGMMGPEQMGRLEGATGAAFDQAFLTMMIEHHTGAITMARTELEQGRDAEARRIAQGVVDTQQAEIDQMRTMLGR